MLLSLHAVKHSYQDKVEDRHTRSHVSLQQLKNKAIRHENWNFPANKHICCPPTPQSLQWILPGACSARYFFLTFSSGKPGIFGENVEKNPPWMNSPRVHKRKADHFQPANSKKEWKMFCLFTKSLNANFPGFAGADSFYFFLLFSFS